MHASDGNGGGSGALHPGACDGTTIGFSKWLASGALSALLAFSACANHEEDRKETGLGATSTSNPAPSTPPAPTSHKAVGEPCVPEDGWLPRTAPLDGGVQIIWQAVPDSGGKTIVMEVPPSYPIESWQLPPGIGYCMAPGGGYPYGYFTMNCGTDSDCPADTWCDGLNCRRPCYSETDCTLPTLCQPPSGAHRFCFCAACIPTRQ